VLGQAELGLGGQGVLEVSMGTPDHSSEGFLTTHLSHCFNTLNSATAPQPPPSKNNVY